MKTTLESKDELQKMLGLIEQHSLLYKGLTHQMWIAGYYMESYDPMKDSAPN